MNYLKGIIYCLHCEKRLGKQVRYNQKLDHNIGYQLCSRKKNFGDCDSKVIKESMLYEVIENHCKIYKKIFLQEKTKLFVHRIEVGENGDIRILWRDGLISKISDEEIIF